MLGTRTLLAAACACTFVLAAFPSASAETSASAKLTLGGSPLPDLTHAREALAHIKDLAKARHENLSAARLDALSSFKESRLLALAKYEASLAHARADFEDGKVAAIQSCVADTAAIDADGSGAHADAFDACLKGKLADLRSAALSQRADARAAFSDEMGAARDAAMSAFDAVKATFDSLATAASP